MSSSKGIENALKAADSALLLETPAQAARAAKAWRQCDAVGLDTEFVRERTYFANLGLVQISDGHTVWLADPLADGMTRPLRDLLEDASTCKIVHSPSEDLEVLQHAIGAVPYPMIDTQAACALLGQPLQMSYHAAVKWLLDVDIDKDQTRSNWCARPLKHAQLRYAALDVCLLPLLWSLLEERLAKAGRLDWLFEDCGRQLARAREPLDPGASWQRIRGHGRLDDTALAVLRSLAQWREQEARARNRPRGFIVPDTVLLNIARNRATQPEALEALEELHPRARQRHGSALTAIVRKVLDSGQSLSAPRPLKSIERKKLARLRECVRARAEALGIEPALLASRRELEDLVRSDGAEWPERLHGWRRRELGDELLHVLEARK